MSKEELSAALSRFQQDMDSYAKAFIDRERSEIERKLALQNTHQALDDKELSGREKLVSATLAQEALQEATKRFKTFAGMKESLAKQWGRIEGLAEAESVRISDDDCRKVQEAILPSTLTTGSLGAMQRLRQIEQVSRSILPSLAERIAVGKRARPVAVSAGQSLTSPDDPWGLATVSEDIRRWFEGMVSRSARTPSSAHVGPLGCKASTMNCSRGLKRQPCFSRGTLCRMLLPRSGKSVTDSRRMRKRLSSNLPLSTRPWATRTGAMRASQPA